MSLKQNPYKAHIKIKINLGIQGNLKYYFILQLQTSKLIIITLALRCGGHMRTMH